MSSDGAALSSMANTLEEVNRRVVAIADQYKGGEREDVAATLYEVERALRVAGRRLTKLVPELPDR